MSTTALIDAVLSRVPNADPETILDLIVSCDANLNQVFKILGVQSAPKKRQMTLNLLPKRVKLERPIGNVALTSKKPVDASPVRVLQRGSPSQIIPLFTSEEVMAADINCSFHPEFLEYSLANQLALELEEHSSIWRRPRFFLFDREVEASRSQAVFTCNEVILRGEKLPTYQGQDIRREHIFPMSSALKQARDRIEEIVHKSCPGWNSELAVINRYAGRDEKLDFHSDQLSHLGARPTIVSLSLGCTREFRLKDRSATPRRPTYSIHAPHNSLIIMHAGCQELFKHGIVPATSIDPDPLLGTSRISITFRRYDDSIASQYCRCNTPMVLRSTLPDKQGNYKYVWQCAAHYQTNKGCDLVLPYNPKTNTDHETVTENSKT